MFLNSIQDENDKHIVSKPESSRTSQLSALKESVSKNLNLYKDNRNQSFENKLFKINSRSDIQKKSDDSKKVDSNVYNNQNIFDDLNNVEKSDSKQNRDSVENVHSIAPNSENEEQGYVSVEKREKSDDSKISESRHSDSRED